MECKNPKIHKNLFMLGILRTFGKIDQDDLERIDGNSERLVSRLAHRYDWQPDEARRKVEEFCDGLATSIQPIKLNLTARD